ncbi:SMI1/KNR4 family protein [Neobacillus drentensis]|uniref:SMI1/KNR4 family protein n=1 Tax=Neobacillus drentensis TaxID=220684 RepID=UPI00300336CB
MFEFLVKELDEIYKQDKKKLRTKTLLYGHLGEGRWHTHLHPPLTEEEIKQCEEKLKRELPSIFKDFLLEHNGGWFFDLLRVSGKGPSTYKGLSIEEQCFTANDVDNIDYLYRRKRTPMTHFIFADSFVKNTYYVIDTDEKILEIDFKTKKTIKSYEDLKSLLDQILEEGKENLANGIYYEFE